MKNIKVVILSIVGVLLLCSVACAIEALPYFKISREYADNSFKARQVWLNKEICISGEVVENVISDGGDTVIVLSDGNNGQDTIGKYNTVMYFFRFNGVSQDAKFLQKGQWIKLAGKIEDIETQIDSSIALNGLLIFIKSSYVMK
ncbi:MAG: hypothetical protein IJ597_03300 [Synergistaceae bacterium]|nr:hypothetical protein [Synergistaceae bacterium]